PEAEVPRGEDPAAGDAPRRGPELAARDLDAGPLAPCGEALVVGRLGLDGCRLSSVLLRSRTRRPSYDGEPSSATPTFMVNPMKARDESTKWRLLCYVYATAGFYRCHPPRSYIYLVDKDRSKEWKKELCPILSETRFLLACRNRPIKGRVYVSEASDVRIVNPYQPSTAATAAPIVDASRRSAGKHCANCQTSIACDKLHSPSRYIIIVCG
ncbi:hypothetical protein THAOC_29862, partial [Thalassiosira oceanica]